MDKKRILVVAPDRESWQQAMLLRPAFQHHDVRYLTCIADPVARGAADQVFRVAEIVAGNRLSALRSGLSIGACLLQTRPHVIMATGGLLGVKALAIGKPIGARTIWLDSVACSDEISPAGRQARRHADLWLSQWADVAQVSGAEFSGSVL